MNTRQIKKFLSDNREKFDGYAAYLGNETGSLSRNWDKSKLKICIVFVGSYTTAAGNLAVWLLSTMLNEVFGGEVYADRAFFPESRKDLKIFEDSGCPIFGIDSKRSLKEFDIVAFSLSYLVPMPMILRMLNMSRIPLEVEHRTEKDPLIIAGGHSYTAFSPITPALDLVCAGNGEFALQDLVKEWFKVKKGITKRDFCYTMNSTFQGWWDPSLYEWEYNEKNEVKSIKPKSEDLPARIHSNHIMDWGDKWHYVHPIIPYVDNKMGLGQIQVTLGCENKSVVEGQLVRTASKPISIVNGE